MRRRVALLGAVTVLAASFSPPAFGAINDGNGKGNPDVNASGKCPAGQNKDTSTGGLKKCP